MPQPQASPTRGMTSPTKGKVTPGLSARGERGDGVGSPTKKKADMPKLEEKNMAKDLVSYGVYESEGQAYMKADDFEKAVVSLTKVICI